MQHASSAALAGAAVTPEAVARHSAAQLLIQLQFRAGNSLALFSTGSLGTGPQHGYSQPTTRVVQDRDAPLAPSGRARYCYTLASRMQQPRSLAVQAKRTKVSSYSFTPSEADTQSESSRVQTGVSHIFLVSVADPEATFCQFQIVAVLGMTAASEFMIATTRRWILYSILEHLHELPLQCRRYFNQYIL